MLPVSIVDAFLSASLGWSLLYTFKCAYAVCDASTCLCLAFRDCFDFLAFEVLALWWVGWSHGEQTAWEWSRVEKQKGLFTDKV